MQKELIKIFILFILLPITTYASSDNVEFSSCVDGDTAKFILNDEEIKVRFLAIDTPETVHPTKKAEPFGKDASDYTCNRLKDANKIVLEYDDNSSLTDKYNRYLAWVWVDDELLQKKLIEQGFAKIDYLYGDYKYTEQLQNLEKNVKLKKIGIWSNFEDENIEKKLTTKEKITVVISILIAILLYLKKKKVISF